MDSTSSLRQLGLGVVLAAMLTPVFACGGESSQSPEDAATAAYQEYWDLVVEAANSGDVNPAAFEGVAEGGFLERQLAFLSMQAEDGVVRIGEPKFGQFETTVDGDSATSAVCFSESGWGARQNGEDLPLSTDLPSVMQSATLELRGSHWIVTDVEPNLGTSCTVD